MIVAPEQNNTTAVIVEIGSSLSFGRALPRPPRPTNNCAYESANKGVGSLSRRAEALQCDGCTRVVVHQSGPATTTHLVDGRDVISVPGVPALGVSDKSLQKSTMSFVSEPRIRSDQDISPSLDCGNVHVHKSRR